MLTGLSELKQRILIFKGLIESQLCNNDLICYTFFINLSIVIFLDITNKAAPQIFNQKTSTTTS